MATAGKDMRPLGRLRTCSGAVRESVACAAWGPPDAPSGFTLLEVLLVLALLAAVAAMAAPALRNTLEAQRLRSAGEDLRAQFSRTRVRAMESGRTFAIRYQQAGDAYTISPWSSDEDLVESSWVTANGAPVNASSTADTNPAAGDPFQVQGETRHLPEGVTFLQGEAALDVRDQLQAQQQIEVLSAEPQWSSPIFFYPDGTASTARVSLVNQRQQSVTVAMRGLTGVIDVSQLQVAEVTP